MASTVLRVSITLHRTTSNKEPFALGSSRTNLANLFLPRRPPPRLAALTLSSTPRDRAVTSKNINKKKRTPKNVGEDEDIEDGEGAFEALFRQLEEDLKNDESLGNSGDDDDGGGGGDDDDDDDDISEEEVAKLEQELGKALDVDDETENEDEEEDDDKSRQEPSNLEQGLGEIWKELAKFVDDDDEIENEGEDDDETENEEEYDVETESEDEDEEDEDISEELRKLSEELDMLDRELAKPPGDDHKTESEDEDEDDISEELRELDEELDKLEQELAKPDDETENEDEEDDDDISEEKLTKLDKELVEPQKDDKLFGALDSVACEQTEPEDEEEDEEDGCEEVDDDDDEEEEEETPIKLKNWQLKRLAYALKNGRRKTRIKNLAADLCLDRAVVLELLRDPPPSVVMLSATLPDKPVSTIWSPEEKPVETVPLETMTNTETPEVKENLPIHVMQSNWSARKRLKKVQLETLERVYKRSKRPTNSVISSIVHVTNLPRKKVVKWFEDKRGEEGVPERRLPYQRPDPELVSTS